MLEEIHLSTRDRDILVWEENTSKVHLFKSLYIMINDGTPYAQLQENLVC